MSTVLLVISYVAGAASFADAWRRPDDLWAAAGRRRGSSLVWMGFWSVLGAGILVAAWYAIFALPGLRSVKAAHEMRRS